MKKKQIFLYVIPLLLMAFLIGEYKDYKINKTPGPVPPVLGTATLRLMNTRGKPVKVKVSDQTCVQAFGRYDQYISALISSGKVEPRDIQAHRNLRNILFVEWKEPEKIPENKGERIFNKDTQLIKCYEIFEGYTDKIEQIRVMNLAAISKEDFYEAMHLDRVFPRRDENLSTEYKKLLGRP